MSTKLAQRQATHQGSRPNTASTTFEGSAAMYERKVYIIHDAKAVYTVSSTLNQNILLANMKTETKGANGLPQESDLVQVSQM